MAASWRFSWHWGHCHDQDHNNFSLPGLVNRRERLNCGFDKGCWCFSNKGLHTHLSLSLSFFPLWIFFSLEQQYLYTIRRSGQLYKQRRKCLLNNNSKSFVEESSFLNFFFLQGCLVRMESTSVLHRMRYFYCLISGIKMSQSNMLILFS